MADGYGLSPLRKLMFRIRETRGEVDFNDEEVRCIVICRNSMLTSRAMGLIGGFAGAFTMFYKVPLRLRAGISIFSGLASSVVLPWVTERQCLDRFLALKNSIVAGELSHILEESHSNHPALKRYYNRMNLKSNEFVISDGEEPMRRLPVKQAILSSDMESGELSESPRNSPRQIITKKMAAVRRREEEEGVSKVAQSDALEDREILYDPLHFVPRGFEGAAKGEAEEVQKKGEAEEVQTKVVTRRSRMSLGERREFNRKQYLEWMRKQQSTSQDAAV